jgi:hypothetical protein
MKDWRVLRMAFGYSACLNRGIDELINIFFLQTLEYGQSEYVRQFGMAVNHTPLAVEARVLQPPVLKYGRQQTIVSYY